MDILYFVGLLGGKKYKLIVLELDDTLLNSNMKLFSRNREVLVNAQKNEMRIALCSGRSKFSVKKIVSNLSLQKYDGYLISFNGANIYFC